jgi:hypothetical protein
MASYRCLQSKATWWDNHNQPGLWLLLLPWLALSWRQIYWCTLYHFPSTTTASISSCHLIRCAVVQRKSPARESTVRMGTISLSKWNTHQRAKKTAIADDTADNIPNQTQKRKKWKKLKMQCTKHILQQKQKQQAKDRFRTTNLVLSNALVENRNGTSLSSPYHLPTKPPVPFPPLQKTDPIATGISLDLECATPSVHTKERETPQRKRSIQRRLWRKQRITLFPSRLVPFDSPVTEQKKTSPKTRHNGGERLQSSLEPRPHAHPGAHLHPHFLYHIRPFAVERKLIIIMSFPSMFKSNQPHLVVRRDEEPEFGWRRTRCN